MIKAGTKFGRLLVLCMEGQYALCRCSCNTRKKVRKDHLLSGATVSCGCYRKEKLAEARHAKAVAKGPHIGDQFGLLRILETEWPYAVCQCSCETICRVRKDHLLSGATKSCGCLRTKQKGLSNSVEYSTWHSMIRRCLAPDDLGFPRYGGRGIKVCRRWIGDEGFFNFLADVGPVPKPGLTIERIDNDGNYEPTNVKWATRREQARNRRSNRVIVAFGKSQCLQEWANETGIKRETIARRLNVGWPVEEALTRVP